MTRVLLAGVSMRAAAASAARAGLDATVVDAFGDLDLPPSAHRLALPQPGEPFTVVAAVRAARSAACDAVAYGSAFEHCPRGVAALARSRTLWGNPPEVLRRVRRPMELFGVLERSGFRVPRTVARDGADVAARPPGGWIQKPVLSGGGRGVRHWTGDAVPAEGFYLQEHVAGVAGSIAFVAGGGEAVPLLVSRQLVGETAFGADGFRYCGSLASNAGDLFGDDAAVAGAAAALARVVAREFGLVGVNGLDFIVQEGAVWPLEVNPRWCASMELVERQGGAPVFAAHVAACTGEMSRMALAGPRPGAVGKAIVFARLDVVAGDTAAWLGRDDIADVPPSGTRIAAGSPICTVFATADSAAACHAALVCRADRVYADMSPCTSLSPEP